jgi:hypothetical protein
MSATCRCSGTSIPWAWCAARLGHRRRRRDGGVIDVKTYTGLTFTGADLNVRQGLVDQYTAAEARYGQKFNDTSGLFMYFGVADVQGASDTYYIGHSYPAANGLPPNVAGQPNSGPLSNLNAPRSGSPGTRPMWITWTGRGNSGAGSSRMAAWHRPPAPFTPRRCPAGETLDQWVTGREILNDQYTAAGRFKKDLSPTWNLELLQSDDAGRSRINGPARFLRPRRDAIGLKPGIQPGDCALESRRLAIAGVWDGVRARVVS